MIGKKTGGLLLAGVAAYAAYKYNKMTPEERHQMIAGMKEKCQKLYDDFMPDQIKNMFGKKDQAGKGANTAGMPDSEYVL